MGTSFSRAFKLSDAKNPRTDTVLNLAVADALLAEHQSSTLYLVPGENDQTNRALPQQPLHKSLFSHLAKDRLVCCPNPCRLKLALADGAVLNVLGHAGQPIRDLRTYLGPEQPQLDDPLELLELTLRWRHMAPTAPDTLCKSYHPPFL